MGFQKVYLDKMAKKTDNELVSNRVAYHNYEVLETLEAGIVLQGTEIKALRAGLGSLQDNFVDISSDGEAWLKQASIAHYDHGNIHNHEEKQKRKLLLHKGEIQKLKKMTQIKGYTLIALSLYLKKGLVKVRVGVCRGKKSYDKREALKKREDARAVQRAIKDRE